MEQIIKSLLENDMYKFSMGQCIYHQFPSYMTTWTFNCRNKNIYFTEEMVEEIKNQIKLYCALQFTEEELDYLKSIKWLKHNYVDFLRLWHPRYEDFTIFLLVLIISLNLSFFRAYDINKAISYDVDKLPSPLVFSRP